MIYDIILKIFNFITCFLFFSFTSSFKRLFCPLSFSFISLNCKASVKAFERGPWAGYSYSSSGHFMMASQCMSMAFLEVVPSFTLLLSFGNALLALLLSVLLSWYLSTSDWTLTLLWGHCCMVWTLCSGVYLPEKLWFGVCTPTLLLFRCGFLDCSLGSGSKVRHSGLALSGIVVLTEVLSRWV